MSENIYQVYQANPITTNASTDLMYFGQSPYGSGDDAAMTYANFSAQIVSTGLVNQLAYYAVGGNQLSPIPTTGNGVLITDNTGIPGWLANSSTPGYVLTANSGAPPSWQSITANPVIETLLGDSGSSAPSSGIVTISGGTTGLTTLGASNTLNLTGTLAVTNGGTGITSFGTGVGDALGQNVTGSGAIALANGPTFVTSTVTMPSVTFNSTSGIIGTTTNDNAAAGSVGEYVSSVVLSGSAVPLTTTVTSDLTSISLTAGDWQVWALISFAGAGGTVFTNVTGWTSLVSVTGPTNLIDGGYVTSPYTSSAGSLISIPVGYFRYSLAGTSTIYLSVNSAFSFSTAGAYGAIYARRIR